MTTDSKQLYVPIVRFSHAWGATLTETPVPGGTIYRWYSTVTESSVFVPDSVVPASQSEPKIEWDVAFEAAPPGLKVGDRVHDGDHCVYGRVLEIFSGGYVGIRWDNGKTTLVQAKYVSKDD